MDTLDLIADYLSDQEDGMKNLIAAFLNKVMIVEALQQAGAIPYERTDSRKAHRNGYKDRSPKTRYGELTLQKPQFREFPFATQVFGRYARAEKALVNAVVELSTARSGDRCSSGHRATLACLGLPDGQGS